MNKFKKNIEFEFKYLNKSKLLLFFLIFIIVINAVLLMLDYQYVSDVYDDYVSTEEYYKENGLDIEEDLNGDYQIYNNESDQTTVQNPILYCHDLVSKALYATSPDYAVSHILELGAVIFPLLFGIIGTFLAINDHKNKLYRHKILRFGRNSYYFSKLSSLVFVIIGFLIVCTFVSKISDMFFYNYICNTFPVEKFDIGLVTQKSNTLIKMTILLLISLTYASIGFLIGTITKNSLIGVGILAVYFIIPIFSEFEIKNSCNFLMKENFDFYGIINIANGKTTEYFISLSVLLGVIVISNLISFFVIKKSSAYN